MKTPALLFALGIASIIAACAAPALEDETVDTQSNVAAKTPDQPVIEPLEEKSLIKLGAYASPVKRTEGYPDLAAGVVVFKPRYELWSDGAKKRRFIQLPAGKKITVDEKGEFTFPVGTLIYKEFYKGDKLHETRVIQHAEDAYRIATYIWNAEGTDAAIDTDGGTFGEGETKHDIPSQDTCSGCHNNEENPVLGLSYVQLDPKMSAEDKAALFKAAPSAFAWPESASESAQTTLGYLHANCGHCHQDTPDEGGFNLRLVPSDTKAKDLASLAPFTSTKAKAPRMLRRMGNASMPALGVSIADPRVKEGGVVAEGIKQIANPTATPAATATK
jgi:hypothetical protein